MVCLVGKMGHCADLYLQQQLDTANFGQKHRSHGVVLDRTKLSSGLGVQGTRDLESLGSNKAMKMVLAL